jgi:predicted MFS family arabinose efflux permease
MFRVSSCRFDDLGLRCQSHRLDDSRHALHAGLAMASATALAIAMEQAKPEQKNRAMATFSIALPLSNGVGALICGGLVQWIGYFWMYLALACVAAAGLIVTVANGAHLK